MEKDRQIYEIILTCDAYGLVREILFPTYDISDYFIINEIGRASCRERV